MTETEFLDGLADALGAYWRGREVVLVAKTLTGRTAYAIAALERYGAVVAAAVAEHAGTDAPELRHTRLLDPGAADPVAETVEWLDALDPRRRWIVYRPDGAARPTLYERPVAGWSRPEWARWEDKVLVEQLWREVGVPAPGCVIGPVDDAAVRGALTGLDDGLGVVVAGDSTRTVLAGGRGLRWVRSGARLQAVLDALADRVDRVRVARFVPGTPCCVIGIVLRDGVAVFDPFEIVTLCTPSEDRLSLCGTSTHWRPDPEAARAMREYTRRVGLHLKRTIGLRGMFSVDGVLNEKGFFATELNPRFSTGLGLEQVHPAIDERLLHRAVVDEVPGVFDADPAGIEEAVRSAIRRQPSYRVVGPLAALLRKVSGVAAQTGLDWAMPRLRETLIPADSLLPDGLMAPAMARFANELGLAGLVTPADAVALVQRGAR